MSENIEIWKDIKGYEGLYQISSYGKVKSLSRKLRYLQPNNGKELFRVSNEKILKLKNVKGYNAITLCKNGINKEFRICRLVALNFIPNTENKLQVNHIDCNKKNDNIKNLEWVTSSENMKHAYNNNLTKKCYNKNDLRLVKKVKCTKTNKIFNSILEASIFLGIDSSTLSRKLRNIYKNNTTLILLDA